MEQYSFEQLPRVVSELHEKLDKIQDLIIESQQPVPLIQQVMVDQIDQLNEKIKNISSKKTKRKVCQQIGANHRTNP